VYVRVYYNDMYDVQPVYYKQQLTRNVMPMTFNLSDKILRCVANVDQSNFTDVSSSIVIAFNQCQTISLSLSLSLSVCRTVRLFCRPTVL